METRRRETAKDTARDAAQAASEAARTRAQSLFETNKGLAVSNAGAIAHALRSAAEGFEGQQEPLARFAQRAAEKIETFSRGLEGRDLSGTIQSIQDYARREPALFYGGAFVAGLAVARFLKASSDRSRSNGGSQLPARQLTPTAGPQVGQQPFDSL